MTLTKKDYRPRLIDETLKKYLKIFGAVSLEGPKWCGKTWTALNQSNSAVFLDDSSENFANREKAKMDVSLILAGETPELIDEWSEVPEIWDAVRHKCDMDSRHGKYILTESTTLLSSEKQVKIHHSGAGRIGRLKMSPMSLYESGDSSGEASLKKIADGTQKNITVKKKVKLTDLAKLIVRGGWPENLDIDERLINILPQSYINAFLAKDINNDGVNRDSIKMMTLLKSLARNESTIFPNSTLVSDTEGVLNRNSIAEYLDILEKLYLIENQEAFSTNLRSKEVVGKTPKRHFVDPSIACAVLNITPEKLVNDIRTFGFLFEALVERDLRIYANYLGGSLKHYRNNKTGTEVDAIIELDDGRIGAIEIKLGPNGIENAKKSLADFSAELTKVPDFKCIICGLWDAIIKEPESGIYILPITSLKP